MLLPVMFTSLVFLIHFSETGKPYLALTVTQSQVFRLLGAKLTGTIPDYEGLKSLPFYVNKVARALSIGCIFH